MPRAVLPEQIVQLDGGIVTDMSPVTHPSGSAQYMQNFVPLPNKTLARRFGLDMPSAAAFFGGGATGPYTQRPCRHTWTNALNTEAIAVHVLNGEVYTRDAAEEQSLFIKAPVPSYTDVSPAQFTNEGPFLYLPRPYTSTSPGTYEIATAVATGTYAVTATQQRLYFRDIWGVDSGIAIDARPAALTTLHAYNLLNQGWTVDSINQFNTDIGAYPSNSDVPYFGLTTAGVYDPNILKQRPNISGAPRGKLFVTLLSAGNTRSLQTTAELAALGVPAFTTLNEYDHNQKLGVQGVVAHSGRLFYYFRREVPNNDGITTGANDLMPDLQPYLAFGQIGEQGPTSQTTSSYDGSEQTPLGCHFVKSPTEQGFTQQVNDGGLLPLTGIGKLLYCVSMHEGMYLFADNGVWLLTSPGGGFNPLNYKLEQISDLGCINEKTVVVVEDTVYYGTLKGIYKVSWSAEARRAISQSVTYQKCNELVLELLPHVHDAVYDSVRGHAYWLVSWEGEISGSRTTQRELFMSTSTEQFYLHTYPDHANDLSDASPAYGLVAYSPLSFVLTPKTTSREKFPYTVPEDIQNIQRTRTTFTRLLGKGDSGLLSYTQVYEMDGDFEDYTRAINGGSFKPNPALGSELDAPATITYQHQNGGESFRRKQMGKFSLHTYNTTVNPNLNPVQQHSIPSSCIMYYSWDYSVNNFYQPDIGPYQLHNPRDGREVSTGSIHPRGSGAAFTFRLESEVGQDLQLIGWSQTYKVNRRK